MKRVQILYKENESFIAAFNRLLAETEVPYLLVLSERDAVPKNMVKHLRRVLDRNPALSFVTPKTFFQCPDRLTGVMLRKKAVTDILRNHGEADGLPGSPEKRVEYLREEYGSLREAAVLLPLLADGKGQRVKIKGYSQGDPGNGKYTENPDCFTEDWYFRDLREVLIPMLEHARGKYRRIPAVYQRYALFTLRSRLDANQNNRNRHALTPEKTDALIELYAEILSRIDDAEILNRNKQPVYSKSVSLRRMLLRIKYRTPYVPLTYRKTAWDDMNKKYLQVTYTGRCTNSDDSENPDERVCAKRVSADQHEIDDVIPDYVGLFRTDTGKLFPAVALHQVKANILLMDLINGCLEIDGTLPDYFRPEAGRYEFRIGRKNEKRCELIWNEGYSLTKYFGRSAYKRFSFHASIPLSGDEEELRLVFIPADSGRKGEVHPSRSSKEKIMTIPLTYPSHTSRLAAWPRHSYWHAVDRAGFQTNQDENIADGKCIGKKVPNHNTQSDGEKSDFRDYLLLNQYDDGNKANTTLYKPLSVFGKISEKSSFGGVVTGIRILPYKRWKQVIEEAALQTELLTSFQMHRFRFFLLRAAWVVSKPYYRNKRIWFYMDKIYKGGDSSEYLFRFAEDRKKEGGGTEDRKKEEKKIYHRYLIDRSSPDAALLQADGYKILPRGSFRHRLDFLNAEKVFATNSTVFAFNDYYLENSRYIRGIPDFDVICLQHGLSVQKIAVAQNRLRDNTRLYCCAAQAEIENLSHPVYNYPDPDVLRLTGIPRYDGLRNAAEPVILISPTWRMQSAMPVTKNEGVERDYNPDFKDTPYFKIYSGLLNDPRLLGAAEEHGCRIIYLMHPITSPQARDFTVKPPVKIVPATADMRYEDYLTKGALMVTDYSGVQFDFAWMEKPVVYFQPPELEGHYEEGSFHYDTMAFGEIVTKMDELVDTLIRYMENGFTMPEMYRERVRSFFTFHDHGNTERVYEAALAMPYRGK